MKERYEGIDGLKAYAILGIALMHILANGKYEASGFVFDQLIPSFTNLGSVSSRCCSDNHTPLRGEQQATIYDRQRCDNE